METGNLRNTVLEQVQKADNHLLKLLNALAKSYEENLQTDWWKELSSDEKREIETGLAQADKKEYVDHTNVMQRFRK